MIGELNQQISINKMTVGVIIPAFNEALSIKKVIQDLPKDIIEEIVGEISDEHDIDLTDIVRNKDGSIKVQGSAEIRNINRSFGWDLPDEDANTISGLIINESRSFPKAGQVFQFYGFKFEIIETKRNLISQVKIASLN